MKISNSPPNYINKTYSNQANPPAGQNPNFQKNLEEASTDSINLSARTKDLQKISKALETEPAERQNFVAQIKEQVETNQYSVNAEAVAEKMIGSILDQLG